MDCIRGQNTPYFSQNVVSGRLSYRDFRERGPCIVSYFCSPERFTVRIAFHPREDGGFGPQRWVQPRSQVPLASSFEEVGGRERTLGTRLRWLIILSDDSVFEKFGFPL